jgi:Ribbon-helix-helix protein, copG family
MRFLVDVPEDDLKWLDAKAAAEGKSRAAVLRDAVTAFRHKTEKAGIEKYFGLWERHGSRVDGLEYERKLRSEWPETADFSKQADRDAA